MDCDEILARIDVLNASNDVHEAAIYAANQVIAANNTEITILWLNYEAQGCGPIPSSSSSSISSSSSSDSSISSLSSSSDSSMTSNSDSSSSSSSI